MRKGKYHRKKTSKEIERLKVFSKIWLNRKQSAEHTKKLSIARTGKIYRNRGRKGQPATSGSFKKGHKPSAESIKKCKETWDKKGRSTKSRNKHGGIEYKKWRTAIFSRDNWTCQTCQIRGGYLEAHHIRSWKNYSDLRLKTENGVTLCKPCHKLANNEQRKNEKQMLFL